MVCSTLSRRAIRSQVQEETPNPASPEDWRGLGPEEALGGVVSSARDYLRSGSGVVAALWVAVLAMPLLATGLLGWLFIALAIDWLEAGGCHQAALCLRRAPLCSWNRRRDGCRRFRPGAPVQGGVIVHNATGFAFRIDARPCFWSFSVEKARVIHGREEGSA